MKKIIALLMAMLLTVSVLAACGSADSGDTSGAESGAESAVNEELMTPYGKYPEVIELHTAKRSSVSPNLVNGDTVDDNPMTRYILDKLNVKTVTDWEVEGAEFPNKLALMLASNDLPDMFTLSTDDYLLYRQLVDNEMLADLSEAYEKCANDFMKACFATFDEKNLDPFREGDALYAIAGGRYGLEHNQLWLRKDWMDKAGIKEMPKTIEDIEKILQAWKENPPVENYAGLALNAKTVAGGYGSAFSADPIFNAFGAAPKTWVRNDKGEIVYGSVMPETKEGLAVLADWYKKGLIDTQFATRTSDGATNALITGGQAGAAFVPWWFVYSLSDFPVNNPGAEIEMVNAPLDAEGNYNVAWPGPAGDFIMVRKDYEHPEAVIKVMNCEYDMHRGFDPEAAELWKETVNAGVDWVYAFPTSGVNLEYADCIAQVGEITANYIDNGELKCSDEIYSSIPSVQETAKRAKEFSDSQSFDPIGNWIDYTGRYVASNPKLMRADNLKPIEPVYSFTTDSMADLKPNLDTLESTTFLKIVMGELPVDAFDKFVEDWYAQGGQTMTDEVKAAVGE